MGNRGETGICLGDLFHNFARTANNKTSRAVAPKPSLELVETAKAQQSKMSLELHCTRC